MRRWMFNITAALSVLLFAALAVLWVRSDAVGQYLWLGSGRWELGMVATRGSFVFYHEWAIGHFRFAEPRGFGTAQLPPPDPEGLDPARPWFRLPGLMLLTGSNHRTSAEAIALSGWILCPIFLFLPARWIVVRHQRKELHPARVCHHCGYDLRATPGRCPECGTVPGKATA